MTDFPTLIVIIVCIFLIGLIPLAICTLYTACQKHKWCPKLCLWDLRENRDMTTSAELDELSTNMREQRQQQQPVGRPRSSVIVSDVSHRSSHCSSHCEISETASDPGMDHINRFLGRSLSVEGRNIYEGETDAGVLHIRRALGLVNKSEEDPGTAHVRRALGIVSDAREIDAQGQSEVSVSNQGSAEIPGNRAAIDPSHGASSGRERDGNGQVPNSTGNADNTAVTPSSDTYTDVSAADSGSGHMNTIDRLPSYEEALDILAKANEPEEPPPCYDDAINNRVSRSTVV